MRATALTDLPPSISSFAICACSVSYADPSSIANPRRVYFPGVRPVLDNSSGLNAHASVADHAAGYRKVAKAAGIAI